MRNCLIKRNRCENAFRKIIDCKPPFLLHLVMEPKYSLDLVALVIIYFRKHLYIHCGNYFTLTLSFLKKKNKTFHHQIEFIL